MKRILTAMIIFSGITFAQGVWFPDDLMIEPFAANFLEPRMGSMFEVNQNNLRLEIGSSMDIYRRQLNGDGEFSVGADMFTYTLLRGEKDFHFPVDAVDYLFGINAGYEVSHGASRYGARIRLSHISAHFVDGHFDGTNARWRDGINPLVYSREFIEILSFYSVSDFRIYLGGSYVFHVDPSMLGKDNYQAGIDYYYNGFSESNIFPYAAFDFKVVHLFDYFANATLMIGVKLGQPESKGFRIYFEYYKGKNIHGEYFNSGEEFSAIGFNLEF